MNNMTTELSVGIIAEILRLGGHVPDHQSESGWSHPLHGSISRQSLFYLLRAEIGPMEMGPQDFARLVEAGRLMGKQARLLEDLRTIRRSLATIDSWTEVSMFKQAT